MRSCNAAMISFFWGGYLYDFCANVIVVRLRVAWHEYELEP